MADADMSSSPKSVQAEQLLLSLRPRPTINFDTFVVGVDNEATLHALREWLRQPQAGVFFIVGPPGSGRSHLLQAACTEVDAAMYLPLAALKTLDPASLLDGLEGAPLLCLDDIDVVASERIWCESLFHCFNRHVGALGAGTGRWLVSAQVPAAQLHCALPDLGSRLSWGGVFGWRRWMTWAASTCCSCTRASAAWRFPTSSPHTFCSVPPAIPRRC